MDATSGNERDEEMDEKSDEKPLSLRDDFVITNIISLEFICIVAHCGAFESSPSSLLRRVETSF